jgi:hypothetical protein
LLPSDFFIAVLCNFKNCVELCDWVGGISVCIQGGPDFKFWSGGWLSKQVPCGFSESLPMYAGIVAEMRLWLLPSKYFPIYALIFMLFVLASFWATGHFIEETKHK